MFETFPINESQILKWALYVCVLLTAGVCCYLSCSVVLKMGLLLLLFFYALYLSYQLKQKNHSFLLSYQENEGWFVGDEKNHRIHILGKTTVTPWLIVLHYTQAGKSVCRLICYDAMQKSDFGRLRSYLYCG